jgi:anti-sigma factor RsiW
VIKELRPHPDHEWLLQMSDGELAPDSRAAMQKHLEACWECRHELQQIEGAIGDAVRYRKEVLVQYMPSPPNDWRDLSAGFAQIDRELAPPSFLSRVTAALRMPRYAIPLVAAVLGAAVFIVQTRVELEPVSTPEAAATVPPNSKGPAPGTPVKEVPSLAVPLANALEIAAGPATEDDLSHSAVQVAQLLHERGADLGDPIDLLREKDRVIVRGVGLDANRVQELEPLLKQIPHVEFQQSSAGGAKMVTVVGHFAPTGESPFQKELARELGGQTGVDGLAADSLDHAEVLIVRAHALRRLAEQFTGSSLSAEDQRTLQALRAGHAKALLVEATQLERTLSPVLRALNAMPGPLPTRSPNEENLLGSAQRLESSIAELLGAKPLTGAVDQLPARLATDLASVSTLAKAFAARN